MENEIEQLKSEITRLNKEVRLRNLRILSRDRTILDLERMLLNQINENEKYASSQITRTPEPQLPVQEEKAQETSPVVPSGESKKEEEPSETEGK